jgi:Ser/Thr protein kinase RdoA (MazF antagonist)
MLSDWSVERVQHVARTFLQGAGLAEPHAKLIRFYQNAIFHLPDNRLTLRIYGPENARKRAALMVSFARFLEERDFPSVRLSRQFADQPFDVLGTQVSIWEWIDADEHVTKQPRAFGAILRALHSVTNGAGFHAERFDPIAKIAERLDLLEHEKRLPASHIGTLRDAFDRVAALAAGLDKATFGAGLLHGDALIGNTILSGGRLVLIDFDSVGEGPREWDLAPTFVTATRFRRQMHVWTEFLAGYGADTVALGGVEAAGIVKQLSMTVALSMSRGLSPAVDQEIDHRIRCWSDWDLQTQWHSPTLLPATE